MLCLVLICTSSLPFVASRSCCEKERMGRIPRADEISCCAASRSSADRDDVVEFLSVLRDEVVSICWCDIANGAK